MQVVSIGDNLHDMSKPAVWEKFEKCYNMTSAYKILPRALRVKQLLFNPFIHTGKWLGKNVDPDEMAHTSHLIRICIVCLSGFKFCQIFFSNNPFELTFEWLSSVSAQSQTSCQESAVRKFMSIIN